jgi:hypothetical protein
MNSAHHSQNQIDDLYPMEFFVIINGRIVLLSDPPIVNCGHLVSEHDGAEPHPLPQDHRG